MEVALVYFAIIGLAFFMLIVRPQRRRLAAHRALVSALEVGDEVVTTGGVFGTVRGLEDDRVLLEVADGVVITVARAAIAQTAAPQPIPGELPADNGTTDD
jgi:preprotein translocase subunit YajC